MSSYTPTGDSGLLVDTGDDGRTAASFRAVTGSAADFAAWLRFYGLAERVAERSFGALIEPLLSEVDFRERIGDCEAWPLLFERPIGETLTSWFGDDTVRGVVLTDALIGTFAAADGTDLRQNRCLLYNVIGNGTGVWVVLVGGLGAVFGLFVVVVAG